MAKTTDLTVFGKIKDGDEQAFSQLFDDYYTTLCFFAHKYLCDMDLSRSLVQDLFVELWIKREKLSVYYSPKSYLFHAVKNRSIDYLRKGKKTVPVTASHDSLQTSPFKDLMEEAELNNRINEGISRLPGRCREIFELCRFDGLKYAEIAEKLQISVKTVEMQMGIALKKLRECLSDYQIINLIVFMHAKK